MPILHKTSGKIGDRFAAEIKEGDLVCLVWAGDRLTAKIYDRSKRKFVY